MTKRDKFEFIADILSAVTHNDNMVNGDYSAVTSKCIFAHVYGLTISEAYDIAEYYYGEAIY